MPETELTQYATCPYCGHEHLDSWSLDLSELEDTTIHCGNCEETFAARRIIEISYATAKPEPEPTA